MGCVCFVHLSSQILQNAEGCNLISFLHFHIPFRNFQLEWNDKLFGARNSQEIKENGFQDESIELFKSVRHLVLSKLNTVMLRSKVGLAFEASHDVIDYWRLSI